MACIISSEVLEDIADLAKFADGETRWPAASWDVLAQAGVLSWSVPTEQGGQNRSTVELLDGYRDLASACMTTAFILSQREAAVRRIVDHGNEELQRELLRPLACGGHFATVGLSQLTTSRQHTAPALAATLTDNQLLLNGTIPWVTGAAEAQHIIIGAVLDDGRQVLAVLPTDLAGVRIGPPLDLMALRGSMTAEVSCESVKLERRWLLAGPAERVMATGRGGTGGLETSCLALGLAQAAISYLEREAANRPELRGSVDRLRQSFERLNQRLHELATAGSTAESAAALRADANQLVLQATQSALTASKGAGFLLSHPAQRWARQALFFLVWSCPRPAAEATLAFLTPGEVCGLQ